MFQKLTNDKVPALECKECHQPVKGEETMAYHLVDGVLYGWCQSCFNQRVREGKAEIAA